MIRRTIALLLVCSSLALPAAAQETVPETHRLRVASWNLLNLFDNFDHPWRPDEGTAPKSWAEMRALAAAIDRLDADVLGVQEVENRDILETLNGMLARPFLHVELLEGNDFRGIDVGLLSRVPVESVTSHRLLALEGNHRFARDFPLFRLRPTPGTTLAVGVCHLKSKRGKKRESDAWRRAEAAGIRRILAEERSLRPEEPIVIMGDFNDTRGAATLAPLFKELADPFGGVAEEERVTYFHRGEGEQIDYILGTKDVRFLELAVVAPADNPSDHRPVRATLAMDGAVVRPELPAGATPPEPQRPAVPATDLAALGEHMLREIAARGKVVKVHHHQGGSGISINFLDDYKKALVVYCPSTAWARVGDLDRLLGKKITVKGPVYLRRGVYQIMLTRAEQLEID